MRTVDPDLWSKKPKPPLDVVRPIKLGFKVTKFEARLRRSFRDSMTEYVRNCSVRGVKYVTDEDSPKPWRCLYLVLVLWSLVAGVFVFCQSTLGLLSRPMLSVTPQADRLSVRDLDFPAIALCSNNIISLQALDDYAKYLYSFDNNHTFSLLEIKRNLLAFHGVVMRTVANYNPKFLTYLKETVGETNVTDILYKLAPRCERSLLRCSWRARQERCDHLFATRITDFGFCCIFNSRFLPVDERNPALRVMRAGPFDGLQVVVRDDSHDYSGSARPVEDIQIVIFDGIQHPLRRAGVVRVYSGMRNASVFVSLNVHLRVPDRTLSEYSEARRGCGRGLWSRCVWRCRARALRALCLCAPHTDEPGHELCSLDHLECLAKHRVTVFDIDSEFIDIMYGLEKLSYFYPGEAVHESLREEEANSVHCDNCVRNCAMRRYSAEVATVPFEDRSHKIHLDDFMRGLRLINTTVIRVFFTKEHLRQYLVEPNLRWNEVLMYLSSQWMVVTGVTLVSVVELAYHATVRWGRHYVGRPSENRK